LPDDRFGPALMSGDGPVLPLGLRVSGRRVVVVGAGPVGLRRVSALLEAEAVVILIAPEAQTALVDLAQRGRLEWRQRPYGPGDLAGAWLAMACTDDAEVNAAVLAEAEAARLWCLRADDARTASAWMPATGRTGPTTVAVHADRDPRQAATLRDVAVAAVGDALRRGEAPRSRPGSRPAGRVVLVGGGPGDPGLMTVRGMERLAEADVVVLDRLAPLAALDGLGPDVEVIDVGKIPRGRFTPQERINELLVEHALAGRTVVRLKGGDPFVFGRGREEMDACLAAGVPVEVVPGVTSAVAVPGLVGVPATHRGLSQGFTVVSGHAAPGDPGSRLDWAALARGGTTLILLMAVETLPAICVALLAGGLAGRTPVVCVQDGGLSGQRVLTATLETAGDAAAAAGLRPPAVVVVGEVAALATELAVATTVTP
jgi:uroporphyrin-III C-methyltransferase/precorrin-2 dehydrogenase/sirohydrochlorin ferrochelatase